MKRRIGLVATLATAVTAIVAVAPAQAVPTFAAQRVYAECADSAAENAVTQKVQNDKDVSWSIRPPMEDFVGLANAGCFWQDNDAAGTSPVRWAGKFKGNLTSLTVIVDLFVSASGPGSAAAPFAVTAGLTVDGVPVVDGVELVVTPVTNFDNGAITEHLEFSIVGIDKVLLPEEGTGSAVHDVVVTFDGNAPHTQWVWGAQEVQSGVQFNGTPSAAVIAAT